MHGTKYSPLDQIDASNFGKLEVAWRFKTDSLGPRPEYKLEGTPLAIKGVLYTTGGTRRSVVALDGKTGEVIWTHSLREGRRAAIAPRQLSGRGVSYWTDGKGDERVIYVTTGYRLVELNAKNGAMISSFGKDGIVDLKVGAVKGKGDAIDLESGEIGVHSTPAVVKDVIIVGSSMREGATVSTHNNTKGLVRAFDARSGKLLWTFHTVPRPGELGHGPCASTEARPDAAAPRAAPAASASRFRPAPPRTHGRRHSARDGSRGARARNRTARRPASATSTRARDRKPGFVPSVLAYPF